MELAILLLDDNPDDRILARRGLERHFANCEVEEVGDKATFEHYMKVGLRFDVVITDYQMRWTTGLDVLKRVKAQNAELPIIMLTATGTQEIAVEAIKLGLDDYVIKSPRHYVRLPVAVRTCLDPAETRARAIRSESRLSTLLENIQLGVFRISPDGLLEETNAALRTMLGGRSPLEGEIDRHPLMAGVREKLTTLTRTFDSDEIRAQFGDPAGSQRFYVVKLVRVKVNERDAVDGIVEDATSLLRAGAEIHRLNAELENRILERTQQLPEANEALETFGFSVSHDLREPIRTLQGYAQALKQGLSRGDTHAVGTYVDRIDAVAGRIDLMISDLLEFARLSRADIHIAPVRIADAVQQARMALQSDSAYRRAVVEEAIDEGLVVKAHRLTLVQAITNLLSNACKFIHAGRSACVSIGAKAEGPSVVRISIADNGIGIAPEALDRIFNVFERLHSEEELAGTGIGLAIVKKGIKRMGGQVGVESIIGQGSTSWKEMATA